MALQDNTGMSLYSRTELYAIYLEVARRDHQWRRQAMYGAEQPPEGHAPFRPLNEALFSERRDAALRVPEGAERFQLQLLRRARFYHVNVAEFLNQSAAPSAANPILEMPTRPSVSRTPRKRSA